jgi:tRNA uridine 5-carboxymethylaminomethyl modification enzyme
MFTSRAEFRTLLRQDNADARLTPVGYGLGLADNERMKTLEKKNEEISSIKEYLYKFTMNPEEVNPFLESKSSALLHQKQKASSILLRPEMTLQELMRGVQPIQTSLTNYAKDSIEEAEIQIKYQVYIDKEMELSKKMNSLENLSIPSTFNYGKVTSLSKEAIQKFEKIRPATLGQASRISGVNPSDIQILMVFLGR